MEEKERLPESRLPELIITFFTNDEDIQLAKDLWKSKQPDPTSVKDEDIPLIQIKWDHHQQCFFLFPRNQTLLSRLDDRSKIILHGHGFNNECLSCQSTIVADSIEQAKSQGKLITFTQISDLIKKNLTLSSSSSPVAESRLTIVLNACQAASSGNSSEGLNSFAGCLQREIDHGPQGIKTTLYGHQGNFVIIIDEVDKTATQGSSKSISSTERPETIQGILWNDNEKDSEVIFIFDVNNNQRVVKANDNENIVIYNQQQICKKYIVDKLNEIISLVKDPQVIQTFINTIIPQCNSLNDIIIKLPQLLEQVQQAESQHTISFSSFCFFPVQNPLAEMNKLISCLDKMTVSFKNMPFDQNTVSIYIKVAHPEGQQFTLNMLLDRLEDTNYTGYYHVEDLQGNTPKDVWLWTETDKGVKNNCESIFKLTIPKPLLHRLCLKLEGGDHVLISSVSERLKQELLANCSLNEMKGSTSTPEPQPPTSRYG